MRSDVLRHVLRNCPRRAAKRPGGGFQIGSPRLFETSAGSNDLTLFFEITPILLICDEFNIHPPPLDKRSSGAEGAGKILVLLTFY